MPQLLVDEQVYRLINRTADIFDMAPNEYIRKILGLDRSDREISVVTSDDEEQETDKKDREKSLRDHFDDWIRDNCRGESGYKTESSTLLKNFNSYLWSEDESQAIQAKDFRQLMRTRGYPESTVQTYSYYEGIRLRNGKDDLPPKSFQTVKFTPPREQKAKKKRVGGMTKLDVLVDRGLLGDGEELQFCSMKGYPIEIPGHSTSCMVDAENNKLLYYGDNQPYTMSGLASLLHQFKTGKEGIICGSADRFMTSNGKTLRELWVQENKTELV